MSFRPGPLRAALALAVAFVVIRVVYRVLFHGADGSGPVVLPLPLWRLAPPLAHVQVLGPVTLDGLADAAASALPIALTILAFGLLSAVLDLPRLIARGARRGPFQGLARAVSIAWATLPSLADGVRTARRAQRLRGERGGIVGGARLLAPVLETTLERATAIAAALELRGYAGRGIGAGVGELVVAEGVTLGFGAGGATVATGELARGIRSGTLTVLTGATGSGKTTLLRSLSGLHSHLDGGWIDGELWVMGHDRATTPPRDLSRVIGVVLQNPRAGFATTRVREEIGLALELRGDSRPVVWERVLSAAARVGAEELLDRELRTLSAGQATLVAIASAIVEQPALLLVDEPLADLDRAARARIVALLDTLAHHDGMAVVVAEHRGAEFAGVADQWLGVGPASASAPGGPPAAAFTTPEFPTPAPSRDHHDAVSAPDLRSSERATALTAHVTVRYGGLVAVDDAHLALRAGEIVALVGANGAGKSSLLMGLATGPRARAVRLVPDDSDALFVRDTVAAECRRADRHAHLSLGTTAQRWHDLLGRPDDTDAARAQLRRHPRDLSAGERRCLALAIQAAPAAAVLLVDEPTRGLDPGARALVDTALVRLADAGTAVLVATHDSAVIADADRVLRIEAGRLGAAAATTRAELPRPAAPRHATAANAVDTERDAGAGHRDARTPRPIEPPPTRRSAHRPRRTLTAALIAANLAAAAAFLWPLAASALPAQAQSAVPYIALALAPLAVLVTLAALDTSVRSAHTLALLAVLAAIGAAIRIASTGVGGVEALFVLLILAGRAYGARFGLLLGAASLALSALLWGGVGPWLPFQMFACGWVGAGAGLLPRRLRGKSEVAMLAAYGIVSSYLFGLVMNMWFWPFAVGAGTSISYTPGAGLTENLGSFLVYSLLTSTLSWDTLRAVTTVLGLALVGRALLRSLRRAKPVAAVTATSQPRTETLATVDT